MEKEIKKSEEYLYKTVGISTGFSTPTSYFEEVDDKLLINTLENSFSKTEGFGVPDSYFESLENSILSKVNSESKATKAIPLRKQIVKWIPAAAAATIALFLTLNFITFGSNELTDDEIVNWFENNSEIITNDDFALAFEDADFNELSLLSNSISANSIEEYLNNNDDIESLLEDY